MCFVSDGGWWDAGRILRFRTSFDEKEEQRKREEEKSKQVVREVRLNTIKIGPLQITCTFLAFNICLAAAKKKEGRRRGLLGAGVAGRCCRWAGKY